MGFRITKFIASLLFAGIGAWISGNALEAGQPYDWPMVLSGIPLLLVGLYFITRRVEHFDLFRFGVGGVIGCLFVQFGGKGVVTFLASGRATDDLVTAIAVIIGAIAILGAYYYALWARSSVRRILENIFSIPELIGKLVFTLALLAIYRIGFHVPLPGLNQSAMEALAASQQEGLFGQAMSYFSMFTGGSLRQSSLFGLGIMPYISASIIFTLLANVVPALEKLQKEGPAGQKKIQEYTRYATVGLCLIQAIFWMKYMMSANIQGEYMVYPEYREGAAAMMIFFIGVVGLTAGTIFLMWLGEQIDEYGIGSGISLLIMAGIVVRLPSAIGELINRADLSLAASSGKIGLPQLIFLVCSFVFVVAGAILITQGQRRIPIQQAKQTRGRRVYGGQRHYMPLRVNHGGVMPIIFASSLMIFPGIIAGKMVEWWGHSGGLWGGFLLNMKGALAMGTFTHTILYIGLIFFFAYFWTTVNFRPKDMADNLRDMGHFIPGLRPGKRTADYLERVMERITYCGAAFLAVIAVIPNVIAEQMKIPFSISSFLGGTGLLIMVSVALDLVQRIESQLVMRNYGGFLGGSTRIKGAR